ncbi:hypothetical protein EJP67_33270 [Variovorax guangxiensis]|uniref:Uncharacterized protein n=1 Tax=Variovorax guangxiensis TaxID=1775474 RepID=A0A433MVV6_9BURK|nr:hypothetical protein [Variovorax guangxiensis]RUR71929.1 hypothetical protein EJP67_33270 [Variovorax guangxiensis]
MTIRRSPAAVAFIYFAVLLLLIAFASFTWFELFKLVVRAGFSQAKTVWLQLGIAVMWFFVVAGARPFAQAVANPNGDDPGRTSEATE